MCFGKPLGNIVIRGFIRKAHGARDTVHGQSKKEWFTVIRSRFTARLRRKGKGSWVARITDSESRSTVNVKRMVRMVKERKLRVMVAKPGWTGMTEGPGLLRGPSATPGLRWSTPGFIRRRNPLFRRRSRKTWTCWGCPAWPERTCTCSPRWSGSFERKESKTWSCAGEGSFPTRTSRN